MPSGANIMVKALEELGTDVIFGYPGAAICPFYESLAHSTKIKHILVRQEQNAGHAASGYARAAKKTGVCVTSSGPGATNLITALATAYMDSIPIVAITGQVSSELLGRDVFQEADITGAAEPFTKYSYLVKDTYDLANIFREAFYIAGSGRPGPVLIDVPVDIQTRKAKYTPANTIDVRGYNPTRKGHPRQIIRVQEAIEHSEKPLICAGGGVFLADAQDVLVKMKNSLNIPVVTTMMGLSSVGHHESLGMIGMYGSPYANNAATECDLLIVIGARVGDRMSHPGFLQEKKIIHIDIDPAEIGKNIGTFIPVVGDAKEIIQSILNGVRKKDKPWILPQKKKEKQKYVNKINPHNFVRRLGEKLNDKDFYFADVGQNQIWSANNQVFGRFCTTGGMGTMGYSIPAAIGAKIACPQNEVIAVCGDGSFEMQMMELATLARGVAVKVVIMKNNVLGMIKEIQNDCIASDLTGSPDYKTLALAYGIEFIRLDKENDIDTAINTMLGSKKACILECIVDENEKSLG